MVGLRRKAISRQSFGSNYLFMKRTQTPCKVLRKSRSSPFNLIGFEWMRFEADVVQFDTATFRPLPSQRCIESRAEPHLENAQFELQILVFDHHRSNPRMDEDVLGLGERAVNAVVRDAPLDHFEGGRSVFRRRQAAVPCAARWFHNVFL